MTYIPSKYIKKSVKDNQMRKFSVIWVLRMLDVRTDQAKMILQFESMTFRGQLKNLNVISRLFSLTKKKKPPSFNMSLFID